MGGRVALIGRLSLLAAGLALVAPPPAQAQDTEKLQPRTLEPSQTSTPEAPAEQAPLPADSTPILSALTGLVFQPSVEAVKRQGVAVAGIDTTAVALLDDPDFRAVLAPFIGQPVSMSGLNEIARLTVAHFRAKDRPLVDVVVPEQDVSSGTVQFAVTEFRAGRVMAEGNEWFSDEMLVSAVGAAPGDVIDNAELLSDVDWLNRNPFRHVDLVYQRSKDFGRTDIVLRTQDRVPFRSYGGWENTGTRSTGTGRVLAGFNWGNVLGLDHLLNYQATVSDDYFTRGAGARLKAHSASYTIPLPWRHRLTFLGVQSTVTPDLSSDFSQKGNSWQASTRYEIPLPRSSSLTQQIQVGTDFKRSDSNLEFGGSEVYANATEIAQMLVEYSGTLKDKLGASALTATVVYSPGDLAPNNTTEAFRRGGGRANATANYVYARAALERLTKLDELTWAAKLSGQVSSSTLLASEQLGIGGGNTVRGFQEYEVLGDGGYILINELRSPAYSPSKMLGGPADELQFLTFMDMGRTYNRVADAGTPQQATLVGAGVGMRYSIENNLVAKLDVAHQLSGLSTAGDGGARAHISVVLSY